MKRFRGRVIVSGRVRATALVSHDPVDLPESFRKSLQSKDKLAICSDERNRELFGKPMAGKALCLAQCVDSTEGGVVLYCACAMDRQPACMLFSEPIAPTAAAGAIMTSVWLEKVQLPVIDSLGEAFLRYVEDGMVVTLEGDGIVRVE